MRGRYMMRSGTRATIRKATHRPSGERLMAQQPPSRLSCSKVKRCTRRTPSAARRCGKLARGEMRRQTRVQSEVEKMPW